MRIRVRKIGKGSLFKMIFIGSLCPLLFIFLLCGVASLFGAHTMRIDGTYVTGLAGLGGALIAWAIITIIFCGIGWLAAVFSFWVYSKFAMLELTFVDAEIIEAQTSKSTSDGGIHPL